MILVVLTSLSLAIWLFLLLFWGDFWRADRRIEPNNLELETYPTVRAIVPARDEAEVISTSLASLLDRDYAGKFAVVLVDDNSSDRTLEVAKATAAELNESESLEIISG